MYVCTCVCVCVSYMRYNIPVIKSLGQLALELSVEVELLDTSPSESSPAVVIDPVVIDSVPH